MVRRTYEQRLAEHIEAIVKDRQIEEVLHFTRLENVSKIFEHGLRPRSYLTQADFDVYASDVDRLDKEAEAISVSISYYYPSMFEAKRHRAGDKPWAIFVLRPSLLWNYDCRFFRWGAAKNNTKRESGKRYGGYALEKLFEDRSYSIDREGRGFRAAHGLPSYCPTFPDAEVQVMNAISPDNIIGVWVEAAEHGEAVQMASRKAGRGRCRVVVFPFEPRIQHKPHYWG